jgi:hypothetical protein
MTFQSEFRFLFISIGIYVLCDVKPFRCSEYQDGSGERWSRLRASQLHGTQAGATGHVKLVLQVSVVHHDARATGQFTVCWCYMSVYIMMLVLKVSVHHDAGATGQCTS